MTVTASVVASVTINDGNKNTVAEQVSASLTALSQNGQRQTVALTAAFIAFTVPTGAQGIFIRLASGAVTLTIKGISGDTGIKLQSGTLSTMPILLPLGTSPSIGILSDGVASIELIWF